MMPTDAELLVRYVRDRSESAFAEIVTRHLGLVYGAALRQLGGDIHLARDVAQIVFTTLTVKASTLGPDIVLSGWLYNTTRFTVANTVRAERRRRRREHEAFVMHHDLTDASANPDWIRLRPVLDDVLQDLNQADRDAILIRFFEARSFAEVGAALRVTEDAARMRVDRALEKLRLLLGRRGIASTAAVLSTLLANQAAGVAPAGLAASVSSAALAGATLAGSTVVSGLSLLLMNKITVGVLGVVAMGGIATMISEARAGRELSAELARLQVETNEVATLRAERLRLIATMRDLDAPIPELTELAQARAQFAAMLESRSVTPPPPMRPAAAWKNAGWTTPVAALETLLWALAVRDEATLARSIDIRPDSRDRWEAFFAQFPEPVRAKHGSPEKMLLSLVLGTSDPVTAFQVLSDSDYGSQILVQTKVLRASGREGPMTAAFVPIDGQWRLQLTGPAEKSLIGLDPVTGNVK